MSTVNLCRYSNKSDHVDGVTSSGGGWIDHGRLERPGPAGDNIAFAVW
jgi:hypothetical protein